MKKEKLEQHIEWWKNVGLEKNAKLRGQYFPNEFMLSHNQIKTIWEKEAKKGTAKEITETQYNSLVEKIYSTLMESDEMGLGEMGEAKRIVAEWMEENNINLIEN